MAERGTVRDPLRLAFHLLPESRHRMSPAPPSDTSHIDETRLDALPVDALAEPVADAVAARRTLVVTAPTGSGKSTRLPAMCARASTGPVLVVQPRRVACRSLAQRVASELGSDPGGLVGWAVRFDERRGPSTRILFVTPGVALRLAAARDPIARGVWLLDEFHERGWQTDLLAALALRRDEGSLVLTSATVDGDAVAATIGAESLHAEGRRFPVSVTWANESDAPSPHGLVDRMVAAVLERIEDLDGDLLVFLPGRGEVGRVARALAARLPRAWAAVEVHGGVSPEQMDRVVRADATRRRVFVATNVAETSLTLPGVVLVIDSGLERRVVHRGGRNVLALLPIARSSMDQRAGRAGRVLPGACLRLWGSRWRAPAAEAPELERIALDEPVFRAAVAGLHGRAFDEAPWISPPPAFAVAEARARLRRAGLLDEADAPTDAGLRAASLPLDALDAQLLLQAPAPARSLLIDLLAVRDWRREPLRPVTALPRDRAEAVTVERAALLDAATHEPAVRVHLLRRGHADRHHLDGRLLDEARRTARQLREALDVRPDDALPSDAAWQAAGEAFLVTDPSHGWVLRARARGAAPRARRTETSEPWTNGELEVDVEPFEPLAGAGGASRSRPVAGVLLDTAFVDDGRTGFRGRGRMLLPLAPARLAAAGCGEVHVGDVHLTRSPLRAVGVHEQRIAEVVLSTDERRLRGAALHRAVAAWMAEGRLFRGAWDALLDALHTLAVVRDLPSALRPEGAPDARPEVPVSAERWLEERLARLGVASDDDLALLEAEDFALDVVEATGWPPWEIERLQADFPRVWNHLGGAWTCEVRPGSGTVTLEPDNAQARRLGPPEAAILPRFRGFRVLFRKASRVLPLRG